MLIQKVVEEAREKGCRRIFLITTNDNLNALGFIRNAALNWWLSIAAQ